MRRVEQRPQARTLLLYLIDNMSSHCGTHVDAPLHSGTTSEGRRSRSIDKIAIDELYCAAYVLDVRESVQRGERWSTSIPASWIARWTYRPM